jgi:hypothetical protein
MAAYALRITDIESSANTGSGRETALLSIFDIADWIWRVDLHEKNVIASME